MTARWIAALGLAACGGGDGGSDGPSGANTLGGATAPGSDTSPGGESATDGAADATADDGTGPGPADDSAGDGASTGGWVPDPNGPAFLHADVWSTFWNDRTRCGAEVTFLEICQRRGEADCSLYESAVAACDPNMIVYGQVGPEQQGNDLCSRGPYPDLGGCIAADYDFETLRFWWYGAEWQGNWPAATLKVFPQGADWTGGGELIALSNLPGHAQAAMSGIDNHGLGYGCTLTGETSGDGAYQKPFGAFAWIEVPTDAPVTVVTAAATNFGDQPFQGCNRGEATQQPWVTGSEGATLGCVYVLDFQFEPGHHYHWRYGQIVELDAPSPPPELVEIFADATVGIDVSMPAACAL